MAPRFFNDKDALTTLGPPRPPSLFHGRFACTEQSRPSRTTTPAATSAATPPGQPSEGASTTTTQSGIDQPEVSEMSTFDTTVDVTSPVSTVQPTEEVTQGLDDGGSPSHSSPSPGLPVLPIPPIERLLVHPT